MSLADLAPLAAAALGGGGISAVLGKLIDMRSDKRKDDGQRLEDCQNKYDDLQVRFEQLSTRLRAVEASSPTYLARWVKGQDKRITWLNDRAYMTMFAPLGWSRSDVLDKTFDQLLGPGSGEAIRLIDALDAAALKHPHEVQTIVLQLHVSLPTMLVIKVALPTADGLLSYEGASVIPSAFPADIAPLRQHRARTIAAMQLFNEQASEMRQAQ